MLMVPALVTLLLKGAAGFNIVIFPAVLTETFKLVEGDRRGVGLDSGAPAVISGALGGDKGDSRAGRIRRWGLGGVKKEVVDVGVNIGVK